MSTENAEPRRSERTAVNLSKIVKSSREVLGSSSQQSMELPQLVEKDLLSVNCSEIVKSTREVLGSSSQKSMSELMEFPAFINDQLII